MTEKKANKLRPVRGMQDMLGADMARFEQVVAEFRAVARLFGFSPVLVPVVEQLAAFARTLGDTTDVVTKEMYSFEDRNGDWLALRPEFTAGIARAYISEGWQQFAPLKLVTDGPLFRHERPQKGRYRQFHQIDAEVLGAAEPAADVELISFAALLLQRLGVQGVTLKLNTLGDVESRDKWREALVSYFACFAGDLSADSQRRLAENPLRILDSKEEADREIVAGAPVIDDYLTGEAGAFFAALEKGLAASGVAYARAPQLVRGFDYYRHTAFEFVSDALGAQATVIGGGRYDGLVGMMGGPETPAVGWAGGIERLMLLVGAPEKEAVEVAVVPMGEAAEQEAFRLLATLRQAGIPAEQGWRGSTRKRLERAGREGAHFAVILGDNELEAGTVTLKNMGTGAQLEVARDALVAAIGEQR